MSTFSTDEVAFLKSRGNLWCSKVWMGLYDKNRSGSLESKDEDALKHHIIQKYEKKSYYVDPNTIQQSLHSATSTNVDLTASGSTSTNTPSSGFIGTTLTQRTQNSSTAYGRPTVSASAKGLPKLNGGISSSLSGIVLPPPTVDPFSSKDDFSKAFGPSAATSDNLQLNQQQQSLFPAAPEKPSTVPLPSSVSPNAVQTPIASSSQSSITASNNSAQESFANFDAAQFDTIAGNFVFLRAKSGSKYFFDLGSKVSKTFGIGQADHSQHQNTFITKLPPPPGFTPPTLPPRVSLNTSTKVSEPNVIIPTKLPPTISVLNPQPAMTKPSANYKLTPSPTRSILRQNVLTKKSANFRVSFDLELTEPKLAPKLSNPSMPDLSKLIKEAEMEEEEAENSFIKNPFLDPAFKIPPNETVKLGETFFTNLFLLNTNENTTTFTDPWSATKKVQSTPKTPATAAAPAPGVMTPANKGLEQGQRSVQEDKYSALKELDDVFKSTVVLSDGKSTGTSIFGSSPMTNQMSQPDPPSVFGPSPTNIAANGSSGLDNFPTNWGSSGDNNITTAAPIGNVQFYLPKNHEM